MNGIALAKPVSLEEPRADVQWRGSIRSFDLWWAALAATLIPVSLIWDFSWEATIGIDRFWSPPHLATHAGVWLSGLLGVRLVFAFTIARRQSGSAAGVNIASLCGPSGAWILLWGAATMQAALIFDNWWQQAYGLGAGLWHPPQLLKTVSFFSILFGGLVLCTGARSNGGHKTRTAAALSVWHGGLLLTMCALVLSVKNYPNWQHTASFYLLSSAIYPAVLMAMGRALSDGWSATRTALVYMIVVCVMVWLLPMFSARPLTAPIHNPTDHMMPPPFPLLLAMPALVLDSMLARWSSRREAWLAVVVGIGFFLLFLPTQWFFAEFLLSVKSDNWFFAGGGQHWPFFLKIDQARVMFWGVKQDPLTWVTVMLAVASATASAWIGLRVGTWLIKLRR
jgi:uncharacterized integral membrane protein